MVLLGDGGQVEARFSPFGDSVSGARFVPNEAWKSFWKHTMELLGDEAQVESCFGPFGDRFVLVQDRCTVCSKHGSEIILTAPDRTPR